MDWPPNTGPTAEADGVRHLTQAGALLGLDTWHTIDFDKLLDFLLVDRKVPKCWDASTSFDDDITKQQAHAVFNLYELFNADFNLRVVCFSYFESI